MARTPLFNDDGLPVFISASGIPTAFWPSFPCIACFLFLPRRFSWWAVRARATLPSAVANSTFFKLGVSFSWEKMDCKQTKKKKSHNRQIIKHYFIHCSIYFNEQVHTWWQIVLLYRDANLWRLYMRSDLPVQMWNRETPGSLLLSWPKPGRWTSRLLVWLTSQKSKCLNVTDLQSSVKFTMAAVSFQLWDQPAQSLLINCLSSSTPGLALHTGPVYVCRCL